MRKMSLEKTFSLDKYMRLELEKFKGKRTRHTCPACGARHSFVRYVGDDGNYIDDSVGRCNRESNCNYHRKPKDFFAENLHPPKPQMRPRARTNYGFVQPPVSPPSPAQNTRPDYISSDILMRTLGDYENNAFVRFLFDLFPEDTAPVVKAVKDYFIGAAKDGRTIFWQIDRRRNVRTGKLIAYDAGNGKRRKDITPNWIHAELKRSGHLREDFNLRQCFFGEHLLIPERHKLAAIVEAEKTAVIASICFPEFIWLACGAKQNLHTEKLQRLNGRQIILYPDADGFALWTQRAAEARAAGLTVKVSSLIETHGTDEQKASGYDLADYLINQQREINKYNECADKYNAQLAAVLNDVDLKARLHSFLDEQKAVMIVDGELSNAEAECLVTRPANLRRVVASL